METKYEVGTRKDLGGYEGFVRVYSDSVCDCQAVLQAGVEGESRLVSEVEPRYIFTEYSRIVRLYRNDALNDARIMLNDLIVSNHV